MTQYIAFYILAAITLVAAWKMVTTRLITHAALFMALSFTAVSGIFLMLQQEFVAALQILIYAGAITTMVIFAIMLSEIRDVKPVGEGGARQWVRRSTPLLFFIAGIFGAFMVYVYYSVGLKDAVEMAQAYPIKEIGRELFTTFFLPFELASVLLLVAMVGAIILTAKEAE